MLPAAARLRRRDDFRTTLRGGRRTARGCVVVTLLRAPAPVAPDAPALVGFAVSRTVGGAVTRNQVARRLRHLVRGHLTDLPPGSRVVVRALPAAATASSATLGRELDSALGKLLRDDR
ncbi:MAG: ribonuclease P protein component [Pseudonocardiales bacterium]|nr:MAG: ribonuclease P protein component [Pseudonocardiales bacterium]